MEPKSSTDNILDLTSNQNYRKYRQKHFTAHREELCTKPSVDPNFDLEAQRYDELADHAVHFSTFQYDDPNLSLIAAYFPSKKQMVLATIYCNLQVVDEKKYTFPENEKIEKKFFLSNGHLAFVSQADLLNSPKDTSTMYLRIFEATEWLTREKDDILESEEINDLYTNWEVAFFEKRFLKPTVPEEYYLLKPNPNRPYETRYILCDRQIDLGVEYKLPFLEVISITITQNHVVVIANSLVRLKPGCVCLLIDKETKEIVQKPIEMDHWIDFSKTIKISSKDDGILLNSGSLLSIINFEYKSKFQMVMSHRDLSEFGESKTVKFSSVAYRGRIFIRTNYGRYFAFDTKLNKLWDCKLPYVDWNTDGGFLKFIRKTKEGTILFYSVKLQEFDMRNLKNPKIFEELYGYQPIGGGRISAYFLRGGRGDRYHVFINRLQERTIFSVYDHVEEACCKEFQVKVSKKDYNVKFEKKQVFIYPKEGRKGRSFTFDLNFLKDYKH